MYVTVHVPDTTLQKAELNVPPALPSFHIIDPAGDVGVFELSVTVAVSVI